MQWKQEKTIYCSGLNWRRPGIIESSTPLTWLFIVLACAAILDISLSKIQEGLYSLYQRYPASLSDNIKEKSGEIIRTAKSQQQISLFANNGLFSHSLAILTRLPSPVAKRLQWGHGDSH